MDSSTSAVASVSSTTIVVILPAVPNPSILEALNRLRGEAASVGFSIGLLDPAPNVAPMDQLESVARGLAPAAVVALVGAAVKPSVGHLGTLDVWFLDRETAKLSVGHLSVDEDAGDRSDLVLAVRVVDFIRARMFDSLVHRAPERRLPKEEPASNYVLVGRNTLAVGAGVTGSAAGFALAMMPALEFGYGIRPWLRLMAGAEGFGTSPRKETDAGSATMHQEMVRLGVAFLANSGRRISAFAEAGGALYFLSVHGDAKDGYVGHDATDWTPGAFASVGGEMILTSRLFFRVCGGAMLLLHSPRVYVATQEVARTGRPAWLGNAALGVAF